MRSGALLSLALLSVAALVVDARGGFGRALKQANQNPDAGNSLTVSAAKPNVDAIAITPVLPYPQTAYFCNLTGDSRLPPYGGVFPLTVRVPVGVAAKVIFANITGTIPGTGAGCLPNVVQQPGTSVVQQPGTSVVQQPGTSVVQQPGTSVVQQPGTSVVQQPGTSVVQQPGTSVVQQPGTSVVQQPGTSVVQQPGTSVVQQPNTTVVQQPGTSVVQQPGTSVVQQPGTSVVQQPGTSVVQQPGTSVVQQPGTSVVQQPGTSVQQPGTGSPTTGPCSTTPTTVVQQPTSVVQQPTSVVQQPTGTTSIVQQQQAGTPGVVQPPRAGRHLLQDLKPAPIEYISNNGSMGQPQLAVLDTVEGVPNIVFTPTAVGQTASFTGALQVAVTTTNDGFGTPYVPYRIDSKLSPNCQLLVKFIAV